MAAWQLTFRVQGGQDDSGHIFADLLEAALDAEATTLHREENDEYWHINLLTADKPDETRISSAMAEAARLTNASADDLAITALAEMDWLAENRKSFPPRAIGSFWIYGTHISDPVPEGAIGLCLDAGQAFGSGSHATTAGCIRMIETHLPRAGAIRIADIGCGSGILAMAAAKWNPDAVLVAVDNDPKAVETTLENTERNDVAATITCGVSDGYQAPLVQADTPYDMILANILPGPLIEMAADAVAALARDGVLILSGLLEDQQDKVIEAHAAHGLDCTDRIIIAGWAALVFRHRGA